MKNLPKAGRTYQTLIIIALVVLIIGSVYTVIHGRHYFNRSHVRRLEGKIDSTGILSPLVVFALILISTLIPPLPLPIPLIEMAAGLLFGFWPAVVLVWFSQLESSLAAFQISRHFRKRLMKKILDSKLFTVYREFIKKKGPLAVFVIRAVMAAPFNISYMAGFMEMNPLSFSLATALGVVPEVLLFVYLGTLVQHTHIRLWYVFILLVILAVGPLVALMMTIILRREKKALCES
jgi:uncharacterized membrane protein YdjX (TVP38/TMEM64 family)